MGLAAALKIPPTQSSSSKRRTSQDPEGRISAMVTLFEVYEMKNLKITETGSSLEDIESTIPVR